MEWSTHPCFASLAVCVLSSSPDSFLSSSDSTFSWKVLASIKACFFLPCGGSSLEIEMRKLGNTCSITCSGSCTSLAIATTVFSIPECFVTWKHLLSMPQYGSQASNIQMDTANQSQDPQGQTFDLTRGLCDPPPYESHVKRLF